MLDEHVIETLVALRHVFGEVLGRAFEIVVFLFDVGEEVAHQCAKGGEEGDYQEGDEADGCGGKLAHISRALASKPVRSLFCRACVRLVSRKSITRLRSSCFIPVTSGLSSSVGIHSSILLARCQL